MHQWQNPTRCTASRRRFASAARSQGLLILAAALVGVGVLGCDEPDTIGTPVLTTDRGDFVFPKLEVGEQAARQIELRNEGSAELIMVDITLEDRSSGGEFELLADQGDGAQPVADGSRMTLAPGGRMLLQVRYVVVDEDSDAGAVRFRSNDPDELEVTLPIRAGDVGAEINVSPRDLDFGAVELRQPASREVRITNLGLADLEISDLSLSGREGFEVLRDGESVAGPHDPPLRVTGGETLVLTVVYDPPGPGPADGYLDVLSNAGNSPSTRVNLLANGAEPCINVVPSSVDFGAGLLVDSRDGPTLNRQPVIIESCGPTPLRIERIEFEDPEDVFGAVELPEPVDGNLFSLPGSVDGEDFPTADLEVGFWPLDLRVYGGRMKVYSNATPPDEPTIVDLFGRGVDNTCPLPYAVEDTFEVQPLDIITLDGSPSMDPDGEVRSWQWTVIQRPEGSVSQPLESFADPRRPADGGEADDIGTPQAQFFVDLTGEYVLELRVVDALGQSSCEPRAVAEITIRAEPQKELHIQLVWSTPDDPDQTDTTGTDIDLHLAHERAEGRWSAAAGEWDCYFRNASPDWGVVGEVADNPTLDIDDTNGAGPENINLEEPEIGVSYEVGAIYFRSTSTFGDPEVDRQLEHPSYVSLRIFNRGTPLVELVGKELTETMQLWHMATVTWCEGAGCPRIDIVDEVYDEGEYNLP